MSVFLEKIPMYKMDDHQANQTKPRPYLRKFGNCSQIPWLVFLEKVN